MFCFCLKFMPVYLSFRFLGFGVLSNRFYMSCFRSSTILLSNSIKWPACASDMPFCGATVQYEASIGSNFGSVCASAPQTKQQCPCTCNSNGMCPDDDPSCYQFFVQKPLTFCYGRFAFAYCPCWCACMHVCAHADV